MEKVFEYLFTNECFMFGENFKILLTMSMGIGYKCLMPCGHFQNQNLFSKNYGTNICVQMVIKFICCPLKSGKMLIKYVFPTLWNVSCN